MKKMMMMAMIVLSMCGQMSYADVSTNSNPLVSAPVVIQPISIRVELTSINIRTNPLDKKVVVTVQWKWIDENNKTLRNGTTTYKEDELKTKLEELGVNIEDLKNTFKALAAHEVN